MNTLVHTQDIKPRLVTELMRAQESCVVISAFVKTAAFEFLQGHLSDTVSRKVLLVRWRLNDILSGATDWDVYETAVRFGWNVYFNPDIHSKLYMVDDSTVLVSSANLTSSGLGLGLGGHFNIESMAVLEATEQDVASIEKLIQISRPLDDDLYREMESQLRSCTPTQYIENEVWTGDIWTPSIAYERKIWTSDLLFSSSPWDLCEHDALLLGVNTEQPPSLPTLQVMFKKSKAYLWLSTVVSREMYFGELTAELHEALMDDPKPYRRDVKQLLADLLNWVTALEIQDFVVDRPSYSQRIRPTR